MSNEAKRPPTPLRKARKVGRVGKVGKLGEVGKVGKLPARHLQALLAGLPQRDERVLIGPRVGEDAAVIDVGDRCLVVATDPVTFATDHIGSYAVHVNANDVAVMGARPRWFFVVLLLPERGTTAGLVDSIMADVRSTCEALGVTVCGGHTEVTTSLGRPLLIGQMLGEVARPRLVSKANLQVGDRLLLTQGVAIEGTALLAREKGGELRGRVPDDLIERAERFLFDPGISVVEAALTATEAGRVTGMHDPTEGGLVTGLCELATASDKGLRVYGERVLIFPETGALCEPFGIDPLRLIASGALLIATPPSDADPIMAALRAKGIPVSSIAEVRPSSHGITLDASGREQALVPADRDEIAKVFEAR